MAENSKIEWTTHTFNPWRGCTKVSPECTHCYADTQSLRNPKTLGVWGPNGTRVVAAESAWAEPAKWNAWARDGRCMACKGRGYTTESMTEEKDGYPVCEACGGKGHGTPRRDRVFCASMADVFEDWAGPMHNSAGQQLSHLEGACEIVETMSSVRGRLFRLIDDTPHLDWLLLTKRPENIGKMTPPRPFEPGCLIRRSLPGGDIDRSPAETRRVLSERFTRPNVWFGTSVGHRSTLGRIDILRKIPAVVRFLSIEPLLEDLGPLDLTGINWVIVGGESGHGARPMHPDWVRSLRDQCHAAGVPFFFKQWGEWEPTIVTYDGDLTLPPNTRRLIDSEGRNRGSICRVGKKVAGRLLDGREWSEFPQVAMEGSK